MQGMVLMLIMGMTAKKASLLGMGWSRYMGHGGVTTILVEAEEH